MPAISRFFADTLEAKLKNPRWSWGAYGLGGRLFLRVWSDEIEPEKHGRKRVVVDLKHPRRHSTGRAERRSQLEALRNGVETYAVVCTVKFKPNGERTIKDFDQERLLRLGRLTEARGRVYASIRGPISLEKLRTLPRLQARSFAELSDIEGLRTEASVLKTARSRKLRDAAFMAADGVCCVCDRDYSKLLGGRGARVLQVHHRKQLSARRSPSITKMSDLAVVCANCHMLLHLDVNKALSIKALRRMLEEDSDWHHYG